jgi:hypothetical protein
MAPVDICSLDFPVFMLADPARVPFLSGYGSDGAGLTSDVEVAYEPDDVDEDEKEPTLRLQTMARRGQGVVNGHALGLASSLQDLGEHAATSVLLSRIPPSVVPGDRREAGHRAIEEGRGLGSRLPGRPWELRSLDLDGTAYALWVLTMDDERFAVVADCGPIVLTGTGRHLDAWTFLLSAIPGEQAQQRLRVIDDEGEPVDD